MGTCWCSCWRAREERGGTGEQYRSRGVPAQLWPGSVCSLRRGLWCCSKATSARCRQESHVLRAHSNEGPGKSCVRGCALHQPSLILLLDVTLCVHKVIFPAFPKGNNHPEEAPAPFSAGVSTAAARRDRRGLQTPPAPALRAVSGVC